MLYLTKGHVKLTTFVTWPLQVTHFIRHFSWLRGSDSNREPAGYGPAELPIALPRDIVLLIITKHEVKVKFKISVGYNKKVKLVGRSFSEAPERARRIELLSPVWKTGIITII